MKLCINERNDSKSLIILFNKYKKQGYYPMWNDPYCEFVVNTEKGVLRFYQNNSGKLKVTKVGL